MNRIAARFAIALMLIGSGWAIGRAQAPAPDFQLIIDAPVGQMNIECMRGCELAWWGRGDTAMPNAQPSTKFWWRCSGTDRCSSGRIAGWVRR